MDELLALVFRFYGLDWMTMLLGLAGAHCLSNRNKMGFVLNGLACITALAVALLSQQLGLVVYNLLFIALMLRGFFNWEKQAVTASA